MKTLVINSISDENTRYCLVEFSNGWSAEKREKSEDGEWFLIWATAILPNKLACRQAIRNAFGK